MKILFEGHQYNSYSLGNLVSELDKCVIKDTEVYINYVGYYFSNIVHDCVFILPKVLLDANDRLIFNTCLAPEDVIDLQKSDLGRDAKQYIYNFSIWIYRAISVYNRKNIDNSIVSFQNIPIELKKKVKLDNTFLEIVLSLIKFNKENSSFFSYIIKSIHSGNNKINWKRTIAKESPLIQNNSPIYINLINKKRIIKFDEELLVIFFSILNYIQEQYGFSISIQFGYELIKGTQFQRYIKSFGLIRLRKIKYKYYSDKMLRIWELCFAFFSKLDRVNSDTRKKEFLLACNFNIIFESIIDELVGDLKLPLGLKVQEDGKIVDHMFINDDLFGDNQIYYIGDSKYYKVGNKPSKESIFKQFTYARNVTQWNLNLFLSNKKSSVCNTSELYKNVGKIRDDETEGYNLIPNFFISANADKNLHVNDKITAIDSNNSDYISFQFQNRLFDRDTLLIQHYNVDFLFVVSLYAAQKSSLISRWRISARNQFRLSIQKNLNEKYSFYILLAKPTTDTTDYIRTNFKDLIGKIYKPFYSPYLYSLALEKSCQENNESLIKKIKKDFIVKECALGTNPNRVFQESFIDKLYSNELFKEKILTIDLQKNKLQDVFEYLYIAVDLSANQEILVQDYLSYKHVLFVNSSNGMDGCYELNTPPSVTVLPPENSVIVSSYELNLPLMNCSRNIVYIELKICAELRSNLDEIDIAQIKKNVSNSFYADLINLYTV